MCTEINGSKGKELVNYNIVSATLSHISLLEVKRE